MTLPFEDVTRLVKTAAARYKRRSWWVDVDDLHQAGHLAALRAAKTFDPSVGVPADAYFMRAIVLHMKRALWAESAPVSGGKHRPEVSLKGVHRASLELPTGEPRPFECEAPLADVALDHARVRRRVRQSLVALADGNERLVSALLEEISVEELAAERPRRSIFVHKHCVVVREHDPLKDVKKELSQLRKKASVDEPLYKLARERT